MNDKEITKDLKCLVLRNGIEMWKEKERLDHLIGSLEGNKFIAIDDEMINIADIVGVFSPITMEDMTRRKNGEWKCRNNVWHGPRKKCLCHLELKENASSEDVRRACQ